MEHTSAGGGSQAQSGAQLDALLAHLQANSAGAVAAMDVQSARDARGTAGMAAGRAASSPAATARGGSRPSRTTSEPRPANSYNARHQQVFGRAWAAWHACLPLGAGAARAAAQQVPAERRVPAFCPLHATADVTRRAAAPAHPSPPAPAARAVDAARP